MTYLENLKLEASKTVEGLAANVAELEKQIAKIEDRIIFERGDVLRREEDLARFKDAAAAKLALSTSKYQEWQGRFRRLTVDLAAARDGLALLENVIAPKTKAAREVAREKLTQALRGLYLAGRPRCQARMAELLDAVVAEHDEYFHACQQLNQDFGLGFSTPDFDPGICVEHPRISHVRKHSLTSPMHYLALTPPPPPAAAAPIDVSDRQAAPGTTPTPALDAGAVPDDAPPAVQGAPGPETSAQAASGAEISSAAALLPYPQGDPEKSGTTPITGLDALAPDADTLPPDLDAQDCAAVDAEYQADLDADVPPDAGKENLGIAADCA